MAAADQLVTAYLAQEPPTLPGDGEEDEPARVLKSIVAALEAKRITLVELIKASGHALTSEDEMVRRKGLKMIGGVIAGVNEDAQVIGRNEVRVLTDFLCDKLADEPVAADAASAMAALSATAPFGIGETVQTCKALFANVTTQKMMQPARMQIFLLIDHLMARHRRGLKRMGDEFLEGYCKLADAEKDPRILMVAFRIDKVILTEFDIANKVEDMFDVTFCYFPITFRPAENDPFGITSEDLQLALRECLAATPRFGILALPLFLDKLQASSANAKRQSLQALIICFPVYGQIVVGEFCLTFWEAFAVEIFHSTDTETEALAVTATQTLLRTIYPAASDGPPAGKFEPLVDRLLAAVLGELSEPDKQKATAAGTIVAAAITSGADSAAVAERVINESVDMLMGLWRDPDEASKRGGMMERIASIAEAVRKSVEQEGDEAAGKVRALAKHKEELLAMLVSGSKTQSSRSQGLRAVVEVARVPGLLDSAELDFALGPLNDALLDGDDDANDIALDGLAQLSRTQPAAIEDLTLRRLFATLPDHAAFDGSAPYLRSLGALATLCESPSLFEPLLIRLLSRLENVCSLNRTRPDVAYAHHLLSTLRQVVAAKVKAGHKDLPGYFSRTAPRLLAIFLVDALGPEDATTVARDPRLMVDAGRILTYLVQQLDLRRQDELSRDLHACFSKGQLTPLLADHLHGRAFTVPFEPMTVHAPDRQRNTLILFTSIVIAFRQDVKVPEEKLSRFSHAFLLHTISDASPLQVRAAFQLLCSTVNRRAQDFPDFFSSELPAFWSDTVGSPSAPLQGRLRALQLWSWIAKALIVRSDDRGYQCVERLLGTFDTEVGRDAARCLGIIAKEGDDILSKENFAIVRLLWKQRFFAYILPKLTARFSETSGEQRSVNLVALASVLKTVPPSLAIAELPRLMPLLLQALHLEDQDLRANVLEALVALTKEPAAASTISDAAEQLVDVLLVNSTISPTATPSPAVRTASLRLLSALPDLVPYASLHSQKARIVKRLGQAIDDPLKGVRREAVDCRARWFAFKSSV